MPPCFAAAWHVSRCAEKHTTEQQGVPMLALPPAGAHDLAEEPSLLPLGSELSEPSIKRQQSSLFSGSRLTREQKAKEFEVLALVAALLLGVAGGGLFVGIDLEEGFWRTFSTVSFCIAVFAFMSSAISSSAFMIFVQTSHFPPYQLGKRVGSLWHAPKVYFMIGYLTMTAGSPLISARTQKH